MPTKTATIQESEGSSNADSLNHDNGVSQTPGTEPIKGEAFSTAVEDQSDLPDSEAETEHVDASPAKKRHISHDSNSIPKRSRLSATGELESLPSGTKSEDAKPSPTDENTLQKVHTDDQSTLIAPLLNGRTTEAGQNGSAGTAEEDGEDLEDVSAGANGNIEAADAVSSAAEAEDSGAERDIEAEEAGTEDSPEEEGDDDEEQAALQKQRQEAITFLTEIELQFAEFRNQVHEDQMARYELEIQMCLDGSHPELSSIEASIKGRHDERIERGRALYEYQLQCIQNQTKAMRAHLHQQFVRERFDLRSELLSQTTRKWYQVNYERRAADKMVPDYGYSGLGHDHVSKGPMLAAIQKFAGFPAAPCVSGASVDEKTEDLAALGLF